MHIAKDWRTPGLVFLGITFFVVLFSFSAMAQTERTFTTVSGTVFFRSDAKLELIEAKSVALKGILKPASGEFAFSVTVNSFEGFNSALQKEHFRENYMESDKFPKCSFEGKMIENDDITQNGSYEIRAKGKLNVHGISMERIIKAKLSTSNGQIKVRATFTVFLNDHGIGIPKVVHQKIAEEIYVEIEAVFKERV